MAETQCRLRAVMDAYGFGNGEETFPFGPL